jgi:UDP-N-acetylglucosamine diphosphorylase/glucosamine-1-phosphate N-acetyltransferase
MKSVCLFEDEGCRRLLPLTHLRPVYELRCGMLSILQRTLRFYAGHGAVLLCREHLEETLGERTGLPVNRLPENDGALFINGRALLASGIPLEGEEEIGVNGEMLVYARLGKEKARRLAPADFLEGGLAGRLSRMGVKAVNCAVDEFSYVWEIVTKNAGYISRDFEAFGEGGRVGGTVHSGAHLLNGDLIRIGNGSVVKPGAVLDAERGPVFIGDGVEIHPNASIEGPAFIGDRTRINAGATIHEGTSIGEVCKVGGEVETSIIHGFSNKQHFGFLGHSYVGMWCNIGAGTSNSDLKNNYSSVRVELEEGSVDSGLTFFGMAMGDHVKTGIHTMFNTGTVVGVMASVYGSGVHPKRIPSFSWVDPGGVREYDPQKALSDARKVMARRDRPLTPAQEKLLLAIFELTRGERAR